MIRIKIAIGIFITILFVLIVKIYYISVKSNALYSQIAQNNIIKTEDIPPLRGIIRDNNGIALAVNKLGFAIELKPHLSKKAKIHILDEKIEKIVKFFPKFKFKKLKKEYLKKDSAYVHKYIKIVRFIPYKEIIPHFSKISMDSDIKIVPASKRFYPYGEILSHVLGYVAKANIKDVRNDYVANLTGFIGKSSIEKYYNKALEGKAGIKVSEVSAYNKEVKVLKKINPSKKNITLSIDVRLEEYIAKLFKGKSGAVIVMNVQEGSILSAGSYPGFDPNKFVNGISFKEWRKISTDFNHPFTNKLINGLYPPGSVVKPGVGLSFLDSGYINKNTIYYDPGYIELGNRKFRCWKKDGHLKVNITKAIRESCDVYFYKGSLKVGIDNISKVLDKFGFGQKTGVDLFGESRGILPSRKWKFSRYGKPWFQGETIITSIGQGYFLVTPMQIARYTAMIATGHTVTPHFIKKVGSKNISFKNSPILSKKELRYIKTIRKAMYEVCNSPHGTATNYLNTKIILAGKTGTAQVVGIPQEEKKRMKENELTYFKRSHAWLTTYGPYKHPKYAVTVLVEHGGHGGHAAGNIVSKIYDKLYELGYIKRTN